MNEREKDDDLMRILYVTPLWSGLRDIMCNGAEQARGMPAFVNPLKALVEAGHQVDVIVAMPSEHRFRIGPDWLRRVRIWPVNWNTKGIGRVLAPLRLYRRVNQALNEAKYDVVYGHGSIGAIANIAARKRGLPCGIRLYGTFLASEIGTTSRIRIAARHPLEYLSFTLAKEFLIVTNDGTKGDLVQKYLVPGPERYAFHFLLNGVERTQSYHGGEIPFSVKKPFILYPARISRWKRQDLAVEVLNEVQKQGLLMHLYFAGHVTEESYWLEIQDLVKKYGLSQYVTYLGAIDRQVLYRMYGEAEAVISLYDHSNLGNSVIEALQHGGLIVARNDGSLDPVITDGANGFLVDSASQAASRIVWIHANPSEACKMRELGRCTAMRVFKDWDARVQDEIRILAAAARTGPRQRAEKVLLGEGQNRG